MILLDTPLDTTPEPAPGTRNDDRPHTGIVLSRVQRGEVVRLEGIGPCVEPIGPIEREDQHPLPMLGQHEIGRGWGKAIGHGVTSSELEFIFNSTG